MRWLLFLLVSCTCSLAGDAFVSTLKPHNRRSISSGGKAFTKNIILGQRNQCALHAANNDYDEPIAEAKKILVSAAETKTEDSATVVQALEDLEKLMRSKCKAEPDTAPQQVLDNLTGSWRLIFTTGTKKTQERFKVSGNYFPIKAVQSFDATKTPMAITNGIYLGGFPLIKFSGEFDFDLKKRKLEFDFDEIAPLGFGIQINRQQAAQIGSSTGLGSESNVENAKRGRQAFFNWISADEKIATARGGGGGLALWKRVTDEEY